MPAYHNKRGFTLIETIIYVALFGIMFTGIFVSIYPFFTGAERLSRNIATEGETAFILAKIRYALNNTITTPLGEVVAPAEGATGDTLTLAYNSDTQFTFAEDASNTFCTPPLTCKMLTLARGDEDALPLNSERVDIEDVQIAHIAPSGNTPRYLDVSFKANGLNVGPIRYYLHF